MEQKEINMILECLNKICHELHNIVLLKKSDLQIYRRMQKDIIEMEKLLDIEHNPKGSVLFDTEEDTGITPKE